MSWLGMITSGWLFEKTTKNVVVQEVLSGSIAPQEILSGSIDAMQTLVGTLEHEQQIEGVVTATETITSQLDAEANLTGRLLCEGEEIMADITITRGDSRKFTLVFYESDGLTPIDITESVVRLAVKLRADDVNDDAVIFKTSYTDGGIEKTDPVNGECVVTFRVDDTNDLNACNYVWDAELNRKDGVAVTTTGSLTFTAGSDVIQGIGLDFTLLRVGQLVEPSGATSPNQELAIVTALDADAGTLTTSGYSGWVTEATVAFAAYDGDRKTPTGLSGAFTVTAGVTD